MIDMKKVRRETIRWQALLTLNNGRPIGAWEIVVLSVIQASYPDATHMEVRRELDYLEERSLVEIHREPGGRWHAKLTRAGIDLVEYTTECDPGIARPPLYWS